MTSLFQSGSKIGTPGAAKGTKKNMSGRWKKPKRLFIEFLRGLVRTSLFQQGPRRGTQATTKVTKTKNVWQVKKALAIFIEFHEVVQGYPSFHQEPRWEPKRQQKRHKTKYMAGRKTIVFFIGFYEFLSGPHFFHKDQGWDAKGQPKGRTNKVLDRCKKHSDFLLNFLRSYQDRTCSTRIQDGSPRGNQRDENRKCLTYTKTIATFYWTLWSRIRTSLFPLGSRMGAQGITKGTKKENVWRAGKP